MHQYPTALEWECPVQTVGSNCTVIKLSRALASQHSFSTHLRNFPDLLVTAWWYSMGDLCQMLARSSRGSSTKLFPAAAPSNTTMCVHVPCGVAAENYKPRRHENRPFHSSLLAAGSAFASPCSASMCSHSQPRAPGCSRSPGTLQPVLAQRPGPGSGWRVEGPVGSQSAPGRWEPNLPLILPRLNPESRRSVDPVVGALQIDTSWMGGAGMGEAGGRMLQGGREVSPSNASPVSALSSWTEEGIAQEPSSREQDGEVLAGGTGPWKSQ